MRTLDPWPTNPNCSSASARGRWVLAITVLGSAIAFLEATVVNVALPELGSDLDADVAGLQWTINGYLLTLASLILLGGSLGDRYGRRRIFEIGVVWFTAASALCAFAPNIEVLVAGPRHPGRRRRAAHPRAASRSSRRPSARRTAAARSARGPRSPASPAPSGRCVGGYLIDAVSWRAIFLINLPLGAFVVWASRRHIPETRDPTMTGRSTCAGRPSPRSASAASRSR